MLDLLVQVYHCIVVVVAVVVAIYLYCHSCHSCHVVVFRFAFEIETNECPMSFLVCCHDGPFAVYSQRFLPVYDLHSFDTVILSVILNMSKRSMFSMMMMMMIHVF